MGVLVSDLASHSIVHACPTIPGEFGYMRDEFLRLKTPQLLNDNGEKVVSRVIAQLREEGFCMNSDATALTSDGIEQRVMFRSMLVELKAGVYAITDVFTMEFHGDLMAEFLKPINPDLAELMRTTCHYIGGKISSTAAYRPLRLRH